MPLQSLGWSVGFALVPVSRVPPLVQNAITLACALLGVLFALCRLPPKAPKTAYVQPLLVGRAA